MRILISGTTYYPALNGQAIFTVNLAEGLAQRGHEVTAVFPSDEGHAYRRKRNGVQLESIRSIKLTLLHPDSFLPVYSGQTVRRIFDDSQPEMVHIQDHYPLSQAVVWEAKRRGIKILGTNHFSPENLAPYIPVLPKIKPLYNRILWNWMMGIYNRLDIVTAPSSSAVDLILKKGLSVSAFPVSCGTDLRRFHPDPSIDRPACRSRYGLDPNRTIFLFVGRTDKEKRIDVLLRALDHTKRDDIQLAIAGNGAALNELKALARKLNLGDRVRFTDYVRNEDLHMLLNSVDIFAMSGEMESLSIASLEAMACGLPLLVANAFALPELVAHNVNGFLFKPGDVEDAAHYMGLLADQRDRWEQMGRASLEKAQHHSLEITIERYEMLYQTAMK